MIYVCFKFVIMFAWLQCLTISVDQPFLLFGKFSQQRKILILKSSDFGGFQLLEVGKKLIVKILYWVFNVYQYIYRSTIKDYISYLVYSHIWLSLPRDDCQFDYKHKFFKKPFICMFKFIIMFTWSALRSIHLFKVMIVFALCFTSLGF